MEWSILILFIARLSDSLAEWVECSPMAKETWVQSQVESYQRLKKWYLIALCLRFSIEKYVSRVNWSNLGKGIVPSLIPQGSSYWNESLPVILNYGQQLYLLVRVLLVSRKSLWIFIYHYHHQHYLQVCPVGWGCGIHWLLFCRGVRPPTPNALIMILNNLMLKFQ